MFASTHPGSAIEKQYKLTKGELAILSPYFHITPYAVCAYNGVAWKIEQQEYYASWRTKTMKTAYDRLLKRGLIHEIYHELSGARFTLDDRLLPLFGFIDKEQCIAYVLRAELDREIDSHRWERNFYGSIDSAQSAIKSLREFYQFYHYDDVPVDDESLWRDHNDRAHDNHLWHEMYLQSLEVLAAYYHLQ